MGKPCMPDGIAERHELPAQSAIKKELKKQLNKIEGSSRDGRAKKYTNNNVICGENHIHYTSPRLLFE
jgi:hypothetical protein